MKIIALVIYSFPRVGRGGVVIPLVLDFSLRLKL
jgi:hypothetical protein